MRVSPQLGFGGATLPAILAAPRENLTGRASVGSTLLNTPRQIGGAFGTLIAVALPSVVLAAAADAAFVNCLAGQML